MHFLDKLFSKKEKEKLDKTATYDVFLMSCDISAKIKTIQEVRILKKMELAQAKAFVESAPVVIASGLPMNDALDIKFRLEKAGAEMKVQPTSTK
ncbi:MAG: ribosomal protein L7/L12 [Oscillospiraceae bacterium]